MPIFKRQRAMTMWTLNMIVCVRRRSRLAHKTFVSTQTKIYVYGNSFLFTQFFFVVVFIPFPSCYFASSLFSLLVLIKKHFYLNSTRFVHYLTEYLSLCATNVSHFNLLLKKNAKRKRENNTFLCVCYLRARCKLAQSVRFKHQW